MSESNFEITVTKLIHAVDIATVPENFLQSSRFEMTLSPDPRFMFIKEKKAGSKHAPTVVPLSNVAYFLVKSFDGPEKKETKKK